MNTPTIFQYIGYFFQIGAIVFFGIAHYQNAVKQEDQRLQLKKAILQPTPIDKEFPVKIIGGRTEDGVVNLPIGKDKYPITTNDASIIFARTRVDSMDKAMRQGPDLFFFLFLKWMNSNFHQGWLLLHDNPIIDKSHWHVPLADKGVDNSNIFTFDQLPSEVRNDNIFFSNPDLFENGKFKFALHPPFPMEELAIVLPPETRMAFFISPEEGTKIILNNAYCSVTFQLTACSGGPGLPPEMLDPNRPFQPDEFYRYYTASYQVSFRAQFKDTENLDEQKRYNKWANTLVNYYRAYFSWTEFQKNS